jgi:hypothetical protein
MRSLARRICDGRVLHLIKMWLECAVEDTDDKGPSRAEPGDLARSRVVANLVACFSAYIIEVRLG